MVKIYEVIFDEDDAKFYANRARIESLERAGVSVERYLLNKAKEKREKCKGIEVNLSCNIPVDW